MGCFDQGIFPKACLSSGLYTSGSMISRMAAQTFSPSILIFYYGQKIVQKIGRMFTRWNSFSTRLKIWIFKMKNKNLNFDFWKLDLY